jgi:hypothetical protein
MGVAAVAGLAISLYLLFWFHWPTTLAIGLGVLATAVALVTSVSFGHDPADADAAWRAAAPDLVDRPVGLVAADPAPKGSLDGTSSETAIENRT